MSSEDLLEKVKKLREITGVGFKDCKNAIDENGGDIDKSVEFLRKTSYEFIEVPTLKERRLVYKLKTIRE